MWNSGSVAQGTTGQDIFHLKYGDVQSKQDEHQSVITYMLYMCILYLHLGLIIITVFFNGFLLKDQGPHSPQQWFIFTYFYILPDVCTVASFLVMVSRTYKFGGFISRVNWAGESFQNGSIDPAVNLK